MGANKAYSRKRRRCSGSVTKEWRCRGTTCSQVDAWERKEKDSNEEREKREKKRPKRRDFNAKQDNTGD
jgi:hypothetical protein